MRLFEVLMPWRPEIRHLKSRITELLDDKRQVTEMLADAHAEVSLFRSEATGIRKQADQVQQKELSIAALVATMEQCGIKRKFGGSIDVDYDALLNALGTGGEAELRRTINQRIADRKKVGLNRRDDLKDDSEVAGTA